MKLEAIREDRTRGGRSTYQCSYTLPPGIGGQPGRQEVPSLLQEIMNVEHLWFSDKTFGPASSIPTSESRELPVDTSTTTITRYEKIIEHE